MYKKTMLMVVLLAVNVSSSADAAWFGRHRNTQPGQSCVNGQCRQRQSSPGLAINGNGGFSGQLPASYYERAPTIAPLAPPVIQPREVSAVVSSLESAESRLAKAETALQLAREAVEAARQQASRKSEIEAITLRAEIAALQLAQQHTIEDLTSRLEAMSK